jgi:hypothetical protein
VTIMLQVAEHDEDWCNPLWTDSQNIEMLTRVFVREEVEELLGNQLPSKTLQELKEVLFNILYPTHPRRDRIVGGNWRDHHENP